MADKTKREPVYWTCDDGAERLTCEDRDEAIHDFLDTLPREEWAISSMVASMMAWNGSVVTT